MFSFTKQLQDNLFKNGEQNVFFSGVILMEKVVNQFLRKPITINTILEVALSPWFWTPLLVTQKEVSFAL